MADDRLDDFSDDDDFDGESGTPETGASGDDWSGGFYEGADGQSGETEADAPLKAPAKTRRRINLQPLFAGKNGMVALASIPAIPALIVVILAVIVFLKYAGGMNAAMTVLAGFTLLLCAGITFMPFGIFLFGGGTGGPDVAQARAGDEDAVDSFESEEAIVEEEFEAEDAESMGGVEDATFEFNIDDFVDEDEK